MPDPRDEDDDLETQMSGDRSGPAAASPRPEDAADDAAADAATMASAPGGAKPGADDEEPPTGEVVIQPLDLESVPRRRPPSSAPSGAPTPRPSASIPGLSRPGGNEPPEDAATLASVPGTEMPTIEIPSHRDVHTQAGGFSSGETEKGSVSGPAPTRLTDDEATVADMRPSPAGGASTVREPGASRAPTMGDSAAGSATPRSQGPVPPSKFSRGTARDPAVGSAAGRGTLPGGRIAPTQLQEGMLLADRYELVRRLGKGGMGEVWQAKHTLLQGMRAIKVIKASISRDPSFRARFLSEGQTMMRVKHPGVVEVTDLDETRQNRELFMVMEHLQGRTMHEAVRDDKAPLCADVRDAVRIFRGLALGMQRIHDERIVHKDLKTDNVILVKDDDGLEVAKVIDFGLAKRLDDRDAPVAGTPGAASGHPDGTADLHTTLSGTLAYMAPEQFRGEPSSFQSDIYAFGVMLFECFTKGEYPMPRGALAEYVDRHKKGVVPKQLRQARPDLDPFIADLADRCCAPRREDRPASFAEVAKDLKWWLEAPLRAKRRKRIALTTSAAVLLVSVAVWGLFFKKQPAGVSGLALRPVAGGAEFGKDRSGRAHLPGDALGAIEVDGAVTGEAGVPSLLVDGAERKSELKVEAQGGRKVLAGTIDLGGLPEGDHVLGFRAAEGAEPTVLKVLVDRTPPRVETVEIVGGRGRFSNADNPVLSVRLDTPQAGLRSVAAVVGSGQRGKSADPDPDDPSRWTVSGVAEGDGETLVRIVATDLAGNRPPAPFEFRFTRDTQKPDVTVRGLLEGRFQVRSPSGNRIPVRVGEDVLLRTSFRARGSEAWTSRDLETAGELDVEVPDVPAEGLDARLVATDRAGNVTEASFPIQIVTDEATFADADGARRKAVRPGAEVVLRVHRSYPLPAEFAVTRVRLRDAGGRPVRDEVAAAFAGAVIAVDPARPTDAEVRIAATLPPGEYGLGLEGLGAARVLPFQLVVDPGPPLVSVPVVLDAEGRAVADGAWSLTQDVTVEIDVDDLCPASVTLDGAAPEQPPAPGRSKLRFRTRLRDQGVNSLTLSARDEAQWLTTQSVVIRADWESPELRVETPREGDPLDDVTPAVFSGTCSEESYRLVVSGVPGGERVFDHTQRNFADQVRLPEGAHIVTVRAVDRAGRASAPVVMNLSVAHRAVELPPQVTWNGGVTVEMRKVERGAVVLGGRTQPVSLVFVDRTEVTNAQYRAFLAACEAKGPGRTPWDHPDQPAGWSHVPPAETWKDPKWSADDLPVVNVAWWDAWAFAAWSGRRLPTEAEWLRAAALGEGELDPRPWPPLAAGAPWKDGLLVTEESSKKAGPADATRGDDVSPWGCLHMGGNVSEWVDAPFARDGEPRHGVRGGSYWTSKFGADARVPTKGYDRSFRARTIGFRCAVDADQVRP